MAMVRSEENMSLKNPVTPPGIDPGTVRLVAQRLNHYDTPGLKHTQYILQNTDIISPVMASRVVMSCKVQDLRSSQMLRRRRRVLTYRRFGEIYRSHLQGSNSTKIKKIAKDWLYRNVGNYAPAPHNIPEEQRSHLHRGGSLT